MTTTVVGAAMMAALLLSHKASTNLLRISNSNSKRKYAISMSDALNCAVGFKQDVFSRADGKKHAKNVASLDVGIVTAHENRYCLHLPPFASIYLHLPPF